ncbi:metal-dependent hydrolase [Halomarina ordinaria]|uniref:Metal-dependent hydrolase n=1 Tax=Halomarina ordinaria TaxID=3033939 RepID=A0ABD5U4Y0_9EURY|nr:metal-dependent hydrolase [Halomarina sp. PSRA2]
MVDVSGHFAFCLLFTLPAWLRWTGRTSLAFVGVALLTSMLPDVDLFLRSFLPVVHHGITHTVFFVGCVALLGGAVAAALDTSRVERLVHDATVPRRTVFGFVAGGLFVGGVSHLFADVLSSPDVALPIRALWPLSDAPLSVDLIYYDASLWNAGLFAVAVALHLAVGYYRGLGTLRTPRVEGR